MADSDPISDSTPNKRRRLNGDQSQSRGWDSQNDSGDDFTIEDFNTVATVPLSHPPQQLQYTKEQFHSDFNASSSRSAGRSSSPALKHITQPNQPLVTHRVTQPTQPLHRPTQPTQPWTRPTQTPAPSTFDERNADILVDRSSPPLEPSPKQPLPQPLRKAPFAKPGGILAGYMAPAGTAFRRPVGVVSKPPVVESDGDSDEGPPRLLSDSDEDTQTFRSNLKPTKFTKGGRGLNSSPNMNVVKESPKPASNSSSMGVFGSLLKEFEYSAKPADDMASAYGSTSRRPKPPSVTARLPLPKSNTTTFKTIDDVSDYTIRKKIEKILDTFPHETIQRCWDALARKKGNVDDAKGWLLEDEEKDADGEDDELASTTPARPRGVAMPHSQSSSSQPLRPTAKQEIKAPQQTIAEKYASTQAVRRQSQAEAPLQQPRRRLQKGTRPNRSPTPPSSPAVHEIMKPRLHKRPIVISEDEDEVLNEDDASDSDVLEVPEVGSHEQRLLKFFNDCSLDNLADTSAQPKEQLQIIIEQRPYSSLDEVRAVTSVPQTAAGKKSRARPIGDKVVDACDEAWRCYDAIDELVRECERIAKPIQDALKAWGVGISETGELELMNLDVAHDSGIGTPLSSTASDDAEPSKKHSRKFLSQPRSMNPETTLKDYQLVGLNWLNLMWTLKVSCILADDMGLGKTCQVISFLAHLQETNAQTCALVIVPGSTLENWLREFQHFAPDLQVRPYYGSQHERSALQLQLEEEKDVIDVVVTTYDVACADSDVKDNKWLRKVIDPNICIFDEAHTLRNPGTKRYRKLASFRSDFRILLTGTPLQNNLKELVAILGFIMPDMFSEREEALDFIFKHKATTKETDNAALLSTQRILRARSMVTPFILRRKKHQVLDLPAKHTRVEYCDMTHTQADWYEEVFQDAQNYFSGQSGTKVGAKQSSNVLMDLRKAALHPLLARRVFDEARIEKLVELCVKHRTWGDAREDLVRKHINGESHNGIKGGDYALHTFCTENSYLRKFALKKKPWMDSGKIVVLKRLIEEFAKNGNRVLLFSQFKIMMDILEPVLETLGIKFMRLDGSTSMQIRQQMIDTFTNDASITVFMLSTRAGGAGINLAAANKVIIFDSGFNPQDDIQAENRAHRVGQTREVEVIRLVTRGTIEEQIHALGESKLALDARVAGEEDEAKAEKAGEKIVQEMLLEGIGKDEEEKVKEDKEGRSGIDVKDAFKSGLEAAGVKVRSKQAQY